MALCHFCGKGRLVGHNISHANNKTPKTQLPNLRRVRATLGGTNRRIMVCTRCLRSGLVTKVA
jgi:large subunit ribosomal protein L28